MSRRDPTGTLSLRSSFSREMRKRFRWLRGRITKAIVEKDILSLKPTIVQNVVGLPEGFPIPFEFTTSKEKADAFMGWLQDQVDVGILETTKGASQIFSEHDKWTDVYVQSAYKKGMIDSYYKGGYGTPESGKSYLEGAFNAPIHADRLGLLYSRTYEDLKGITSAMSTQIARTLTQGMADGLNPRVIARQLNKAVDGIGRVRAEMLARTEIIRSHAEASLNTYGSFGEEAVFLEAEWLAANDDRVCPYCAELSGQVFTIQEARGMIPLHPNCRCSWIPVKAKKKKQVPIQKPEPEQSDLPSVPIPKQTAIPGGKYQTIKTVVDLPQKKRVLSPEALQRMKQEIQKKIPLQNIPDDISGAGIFGKRLTKTNLPSPGGSTGAQIYKDTDGNKWLVKAYGGDEDRVREEWVANKLYQLNGTKVPNARLATIKGKKHVAFEYLPDEAKTAEAWINEANGAERMAQLQNSRSIKKNFVADAYLANWDVAGLSYDNIMLLAKGDKLDKLNIWRIDQGGSLRYRAQGSPKGKLFGSKVTELDSLRDASMNHSSARLFEMVDGEDIAKQIRTLVPKLTKSKIDRILGSSGMSADDIAELREILLARKKFLRQWEKAYTEQKAVKEAVEEVTETVSRSLPDGEAITEREAAEIVRSGGNGYGVRLDGDQLEDQQVVFWTEKDIKGDVYIKARFKATEEGAKVLDEHSFKFAKMRKDFKASKFKDGMVIRQDADNIYANTGEKVYYHLKRSRDEKTGTVIEWLDSETFNDHKHYAVRNSVEMTLKVSKNPTAADFQKAREALSNFGLNTHRPSALEKEDYYLRVLYNLKHNEGIGALANETIEERVRLLRMVIKAEYDTDLSDIGSLVEGVRERGTGRLVYRRPDWKKFEKAEEKVFLYHELCADAYDVSAVLDSILSSGGKLTSTTTKIHNGIQLYGKSPSSDLKTGGADFVFTRVFPKGDEYMGNRKGIHWKFRKASRSDVISYKEDYFGECTSKEFVKFHRVTDFDELTEKVPKMYEDNESLFKGSLDILEGIEKIQVSENERELVLDVFRKHSIMEIDGRPIEEVVVSS